MSVIRRHPIGTALATASVVLTLLVGAVAAEAISGPSVPGVNKKLLGTYSATLNIRFNSCPGNDGTYTGQITLLRDGTWTSTGFSSTLGPNGLSGSWLELGTTIALSETQGIEPCFSDNPHGGTYMAKVTFDSGTGKYAFASVSAPGRLNEPYNWTGNWYASEN
jgi:hypothetical protein